MKLTISEIDTVNKVLDKFEEQNAGEVTGIDADEKFVYFEVEYQKDEKWIVEEWKFVRNLIEYNYSIDEIVDSIE
jgi:hypothetical protein